MLIYVDPRCPKTDCVWYDISPSGEEVCVKQRLMLTWDKVCPCGKCKEYEKFKIGVMPRGISK